MVSKIKQTQLINKNVLFVFLFVSLIVNVVSAEKFPLKNKDLGEFSFKNSEKIGSAFSFLNFYFDKEDFLNYFPPHHENFGGNFLYILFQS